MEQPKQSSSLSTGSAASQLSAAPVRIRVRYLDVLGHALLADTQVSGILHRKIVLPWRVIRGYRLIRVENYTETFRPVPDGIQMIYSAQKAAPVVVYHRNAEGNLLVPPQYVSGELNDAYHLRPLPNNPFPILRAPTESAGVFTTKGKVAQYIYDTLQVLALPVNQELFCKVLTPVHPYRAPVANQPLAKALPAASTWPIYRAVMDRFNREQWFDIGGGVWLKRTAQLQLLQRPRAVAGPRTTSFVHRAEVVSHRSSAVPLYRFPQFAQPVRTLTSGTVVQTRGVLADDKGYQWIELTDHLFISRLDLLIID